MSRLHDIHERARERFGHLTREEAEAQYADHMLQHNDLEERGRLLREERTSHRNDADDLFTLLLDSTWRQTEERPARAGGEVQQGAPPSPATNTSQANLCLSVLAQTLPVRHLSGVQGLYLSRYKLATRGEVRAYLHRFHRPDEDEELHDHPWAWATSLVLSGGYVEEVRLSGATVERRVLRAGDVNAITGNTWHRISHVEPNTWTLFLVGPRVKDWSFWSRDTGATTPWREFVAAKGIPIVGEEQ